MLFLFGFFLLLKYIRLKKNTVRFVGNTLTVGIITYNEENNIKRCITSCKKLNPSEIIIVDSFSTDKTIASCGNDVTIKVNKFRDYASQRNFLIELVQSDYILMIDADEEITDELALSIKNFLETSNGEGALIRRRCIFNGQTLHYVFQPDWCLKLFRQRKNRRYRGIVHEEINDLSKKNLPILDGYLNHYSWSSIEHYLKKLLHYAKLDIKKGKKRYSFFLPFAASYGFIKFYIFKCGFMDGNAGLLFSIGQAYYVAFKGYLANERFKDI